jgi:hypothetical protein
MLIRYALLACLFCSSTAFATATVSLSAPNPAVLASYASNSSQTVIYTVTNNVPNKSFPFTISGISAPLSRTTVSNDCNQTIPAGPSTCNIGIAISPTAGEVGLTINQTLQLNYQGRTPLTSQLSFSVIQQFFAYVLPTIFPQIIDQFTIDTTTGLLSSNPATAYSSNTQTYKQLTFASVNGTQYAYVTDPNIGVYQCTINNTNGSFNTCTALSAPPGWIPYGIAFATVNNVQYAYVTDVGNGNIFQCSLNSNGSFSSCATATPQTFFAPYDIAFATINSIQYAYVTDAGSGGVGNYGDVYQCLLNNDGTFSACTIATSLISTPLWIPYSIAFTSLAGIQYAYVSDNGTSTTPANGNVYLCLLDANGLFTQCNPTPSSTPIQWNPYFMAFATLNDIQYAYVTDVQGPLSGRMYRCILADNDAGALSDCQLTPTSPPSSWQPIGIAFRF